MSLFGITPITLKHVVGDRPAINHYHTDQHLNVAWLSNATVASLSSYRAIACSLPSTGGDGRGGNRGSPLTYLITAKIDLKLAT
jgi:hypothetical protein